MRRNPLEWLADAMLTVTMIPVLAMMVHVSLDVAMKYTIATPIQGTLEITAYYYMVAIVMLPLAFVEATRQSIAVELVYQMMPSALRVITTGFVLLLSAAGYGGLAYITWPDALEALAKREIVMGTVNIVIWPARFLMPVTLFVSALICLFYFFKLFADSNTRDRLTSLSQVDPDTEVN